MDLFEYEITTHDAEHINQMVFFCSASGDCGLADIPDDQPTALLTMLNQRGLEGWELIQLLPGKDGFMACWKRKIQQEGGLR